MTSRETQQLKIVFFFCFVLFFYRVIETLLIGVGFTSTFLSPSLQTIPIQKKVVVLKVILNLTPKTVNEVFYRKFREFKIYDATTATMPQTLHI